MAAQRKGINMFGAAKASLSASRTHRAHAMGGSPGDASTRQDEPLSLPTGVASGMAAGTRVATSIGWRAVEMVAAGDRVLTFDNGLQVVTQVTHAMLWPATQPCPRHLWPLHVPAGALDNAQPLVMLPEQSVMVESDVGEAIYGDPFTLVPAAALEGYRGIERVRPTRSLTGVTLHFGNPQVVFVSAGTLFFCPSQQSGTVADLLHDETGGYTVLPFAEAPSLLASIKTDVNELTASASSVA